MIANRTALAPRYVAAPIHLSLILLVANTVGGRGGQTAHRSAGKERSHPWQATT